MRLRWSDRAKADLVEIGAFIARDDPVAAQRWVARLWDRAGLAARHPTAGRVVPEFGLEDIREVLLGNYRIVYRVLPDDVHVLVVSEGHRLLRESELSESRPS